MLILDNLATHKVQGVEPLLRAKGIVLCYLPPYSPDFNPIEPALAKLRAHLRQAAARTLAQLLTAFANSLNTFSATDCRPFYCHAQYASI
jgi:transposase